MFRRRSSPAVPPLRPQRGFALLLTLVLVGLLVLLLAGLATYTRIETRAADNALHQLQARQNALMALNIALGQLQKYAGPDPRVTATAEAFNGGSGTRYYTGVWDAATDGAAPLTWLVSGNETAPRAVDPATAPTADYVELVGAGSAAAGSVRARKQSLTTDVPGVGTTTVGNYAWWIGDEGVKASIGLPDRLADVKYSPWDTDAQRARIRQQIAGTPHYFRDSSSARYGFDPQMLATTQAQHLATPSQLRLIPAIAGDQPAFLRAHFFDFTVAAKSVLANTLADGNRGLLKDLSLSPAELGAAFAAYANFANYMETPNGSGTAFPSIGNADSPRRRYVVTAPVSNAGTNGLPALSFSVAPVITDFLLQFGLDRTVASQAYVKARLYIGLWNPYTSALVPPTTSGDLTVEVSGLPTITATNFQGVSGPAVSLLSPLPSALTGGNGAWSVDLQFGTTTSGSQSDKASWLPGRYYFWVTPTGTSASGVLTFYNKNLNASGWQYPQFALAGGASNTTFGISAPAVANLTVTLKAKGSTLAVYHLPAFQSVSQPTNTLTWKVGYAFRLAQPSTLNSSRSWLQNPDFRAADLPSSLFTGFDPNLAAFDPSAYNSSSTPVTSQHLNQFLIYRVGGAGGALDSASANNDVPLFELPRQPILSLGQLQHLQVTGQRPFSIGNSWGGSANTVFDRFFFSGLPSTGASPNFASREPLPNWNLIPLESRSSPASALSLDVVRAAAPQTSRFLMQAGGFNVNSLSVAAWRAVLSSVRFSADAPFSRADITNTSGSPTLGSQNGSAVKTEGLTDDSTLGSAHREPVFVRFPQSAQETYYWEAGSSTHAQVMSTQTFRMGVRGANAAVSDPALSTLNQYHLLTTDQIETLATRIVELLTSRLGQRGPFRTMEEFLSASADFGGASLLEKAIADVGLNAAAIRPQNASADGSGAYSAPGFSSLTLTQADILSALAPYLRTRSDTFVIRTYGAKLNATTGDEEARAWLEATVQRVPAAANPTDDIAQPSLTGLGRRCQVISFRWLSSSEL